MLFTKANELEGCVMYAATIDRHALNGLFDNQKKLDDLFDSIFDDDNYFISSTSSSQSESLYSMPSRAHKFTPKPSPVKDSLLRVKENSPYVFMLPIVLEIAAIYFVVSHLF
jgi:hypothetical protein